MRQLDEPVHELGKVASEGGISIQYARYLCDMNRIPHFRTTAGTRLVLDSDLHRFVEERRKKGLK